MSNYQNPMFAQSMLNPYGSQFIRQNTYYPQQNNGINWVQGIEGAKAWQLPPNSNVLLMDSENDNRFYIKISDAVGMCNLRIFNYSEITEQKSSEIDMSQYVKKSELESLISKLLGGTNESAISGNDSGISTQQQSSSN